MPTWPFPPTPRSCARRRIGHVVVNSAMDKPWSQYFCCTMVGNREFVRKHPVATKRALRAILKATDLCAQRARAGGAAPRRQGVREAIRLRAPDPARRAVDRWREYDPEDTVRFYALRLHEAGMIKSSPQRIIAQGTDWRFLNELKKELKG